MRCSIGQCRLHVNSKCVIYKYVTYQIEINNLFVNQTITNNTPENIHKPASVLSSNPHMQRENYGNNSPVKTDFKTIEVSGILTVSDPLALYCSGVLYPWLISLWLNELLIIVTQIVIS